MKLYDYQEKGVEFLASRKRALLADGMGLGKSAQLICAAEKIQAKEVLVICPGMVRFVIANEYKKFANRECNVILSSKDKVKPGINIVSYTLVNSDKLFKLLYKKWDLLILDEAHFLKNNVAKRTKRIFGKLLHKCDVVWCASGTPMPNNPSELWPMINFVFDKKCDFYRFRERYCTGYETDYGYKIVGAQNTDELKEVMKPFMLRRIAKNVLKDLPPITYTEVPMYLENIKPLLDEAKALRHYDKVMGVLADLDPDLAMDEIGRPMYGELRKLIGVAKAIPCADFIKEKLESGVHKIVVMAVHRDVIEMIAAELEEYGPEVVYGGMKDEAKDRKVSRFRNKDTCRVLVANIQVAGTGLTLTESSEMVFAEMSWIPGDNAQAAKRVHRIGQAQHVNVSILSLAKSIDEQVTASLFTKMQMIKMIME